MIIHLIIISSAVQIYEFSYIHEKENSHISVPQVEA